jgi:hypothetical protein
MNAALPLLQVFISKCTTELMTVTASSMGLLMCVCFRVALNSDNICKTSFSWYLCNCSCAAFVRTETAEKTHTVLLTCRHNRLILVAPLLSDFN